MFSKAFDSSDIFQINSHIPMIYYEPYYIKKYFQHQIKLPPPNVKKKNFIFVMAPICVATPICIGIKNLILN